NSDVALIKIDPEGLSLTPLQLGQSHSLTVGDPVAAIGSPFGEEQSLSVGVISAVDRDIESLTQFRIGNAIQTDAAINKGNSGGPLLDSHGRVIGINSAIYASQDSNTAGIAFAIPVNTARRVAEDLIKYGHVRRATLGAEGRPLFPQLAQVLGLSTNTGILIEKVEPNGPAAQ